MKCKYCKKEPAGAITITQQWRGLSCQFTTYLCEVHMQMTLDTMEKEQ